MLPMRTVEVILGTLVLLPWLAACPGESSDDGQGVTGNTNTTPTSQSGLDAPSPPACEDIGGTCTCAGSCNPGDVPSTEGTCPQPPAEAGACGLECCVPAAGTSGTSGTTASTAGTAATGDSTAATADTSPPVCDCATLPLCVTPQDEDCNGQYADGHCCDDTAAAMTCTCLDPCDGGFPCCTLQPGCT